jgi:hypothetical protein
MLELHRLGYKHVERFECIHVRLAKVSARTEFAYEKILLDTAGPRGKIQDAVVVEHLAQVLGMRSLSWGVRASL